VQPHTLFVNRLGRRLSLRQCHLRHEELFYPNDPPKCILWQSAEEPELLEVNQGSHLSTLTKKVQFYDNS
jgi:vacuolar protein sorting-associated protein 13A/C